MCRGVLGRAVSQLLMPPWVEAAGARVWVPALCNVWQAASLVGQQQLWQ